MIAPATSHSVRPFSGGVHPHDHKELAADRAIEVLPAPATVAIPVVQHAGAPCEPMVKMKDVVAWNDIIANADAFVSAPVHSSVAGTVGILSVTTLPNGRHVRTVPVKAAAGQPDAAALMADVLGGDWPLDAIPAVEPDAIVKAVRAAGLVGQGGAAFPTHVKLTRNAQRPVDTLLLNGCECEPYLTSDYRLMIEAPKPIIAGALLAARACGATDIVIAVEDNKPKAVASLRAAAQGSGIRVVETPTKYPMGGERQVIPTVLGRKVPTGGLPLDVGIVVINVGTSAAIARAVLRGKPLTHRVVSVTGAGIATPKNILAPVGASIASLIEFCGGLKPDAARVIAGGPMMGFTLNTLDVPVTKGTSGIVVLTAREAKRSEETPCVRCGRCVDVCPLHLVPTKLAMSVRYKDWDTAKRYHLRACMECGCCAFVCPAGIPLVQLIRQGKVSKDV